MLYISMPSIVVAFLQFLVSARCSPTMPKCQGWRRLAHSDPLAAAWTFLPPTHTRFDTILPPDAQNLDHIVPEHMGTVV